MEKSMRPTASLIPFTAALLMVACAGLTGSGPSAVATLEPTRGSTATGSITFEQQDQQVRVSGRVSGLKPGQEHGFHIHEKGDCSSGDGMSAGGHFNPLSKPHGPQGGERHAGDLPSLRADAAGVATIDVRIDGITIGSGATDIVGRGLIVHAQPDDYKTQPTGNAGARLACAVIQRR
jgi:Cu-Zn family superoxide dismutase